MTTMRRLGGAMERLLKGQARREDGQAIIIAILALAILLAMAGFTIDIGRVYVAQRQLQQAVDSATLAAAQDMPNTTVANTTGVTYSAGNGDLNNHYGLSAAAATVKFACDNGPGNVYSTAVPCRLDPNAPTGNPNNPCKTSPGCNSVTVTETANVEGTFLNALRAIGLTIPSFNAVGTSSTALMRGGVPHPIDMMVVIDASGSMVSTMCGYAVGTGSAPQGIAANKTTDLDCAKEGVRSLLQTLYPCAPSQLDCTGQPSVDKVGLEIFPGLNDPNGLNHDSGFGLPNNILEAGCPGGLTTTPTWYTSNEAQIVTLNKATGGSFTLTFKNNAGTSATTAPIQWNDSAATVQLRLRALANVGGQNITVTSRLLGGPYTVLFDGTLGNMNITNQMTATSSLTPTTPPANAASVTVTTDQDGFVPAFPAPSTNWYLQSDDTGYSSGSGFQIAPLSNDYRQSAVTPTLNPASPLVDTVSWSACPNQAYPGNYRYGAAALNRPAGAGGTGSSNGAYSSLVGAINSASLTLQANAPADNAQGVIVVLSDGDMNYEPPGAATFEPCHEAVTAAASAAAAGIWVYSIAYNASQKPATTTPIVTSGNGNSSCQLSVNGQQSDQSDPTGKLNGFATMYSIARNSTTPAVPDPQKFYCLPAVAAFCQDGNATTLSKIFVDIGNDVLSKQRLVSG